MENKRLPDNREPSGYGEDRIRSWPQCASYQFYCVLSVSLAVQHRSVVLLTSILVIF